MSYLILTPNICGRDGVSRLTREIARILKSFSDDVDLWSFLESSEASEHLDELGLRSCGAGGSKPRALAFALERSTRSCRGTKVVVTHAHLAPLSLPLHWRGARVYQMLLGVEVWKPLSAIQAASFRVSERLVCISAHTKERFESINPGFDNVTVCHLGIPDRSSSASADDGYALVVGRMASSERYKGHDSILEVWRDVVERAPGAKLVVAGDGDDRHRLVGKSRELGLSDAVRFVGAVSDEELDHLYRACSFFVMPSADEGFGLVFLEAMRASKACIGAVGSASEIIEDGSTGFVIDARDRDGLTRRLVDLFNDAERRAEMGERGRERYRDLFTSEQFRERLRQVLA